MTTDFSFAVPLAKGLVKLRIAADKGRDVKLDADEVDALVKSLSIMAKGIVEEEK